MGWSGQLWETLMFLCAFIAFCDISPPGGRKATDREQKNISRPLDVPARCGTGGAGVSRLRLSEQKRASDGHPLAFQHPSYLVRDFGIHRLGLLDERAVVSDFSNQPHGVAGLHDIDDVPLSRQQTGHVRRPVDRKHVNIGIALGSRAAIAATGLLLGAMLYSTATRQILPRVRFTLLLMADAPPPRGCSAGFMASARKPPRRHGRFGDLSSPRDFGWPFITSRMYIQ